MKKLLGCILGFALVTSAVFAMGGSDGQTKGASNGPVTITWWEFPNFGGEGDFERGLIAAFEAKNPGIKVNFEMISYMDDF